MNIIAVKTCIKNLNIFSQQKFINYISSPAEVKSLINVSKKIHNTDNKKIWQRSYHNHIIRDEKDYQKIWEHIDTNPLKWELNYFYND